METSQLFSISKIFFFMFYLYIYNGSGNSKGNNTEDRMLYSKIYYE